MNKKVMIAVGIVLALVAVAGTYYGFVQKNDAMSTANAEKSAAAPIVEISQPSTLTAPARLGKRLFDKNCAACHGASGVGQDGVAPPLIHKIYEPSHHGDESFQSAVKNGVRAHHWPFGNMPPVEGLSRQDVAAIVLYIREVQRANGIN